jgi:ferrochelatase
MATAPALGAIFVAHGSIADLDEIPLFLERIRHGRKPSAELVLETRRRYALIGKSPLLEVTLGQAAAVEGRLGVPVLVGMRLSDPTLESAFERAEALGLRRVALVPLAPFSVHVYQAHAERTRSQRTERGHTPPELVPVPLWGSHPALVRAHADAIRPALGPDTELILTAHSLPTGVIRGGDPYESEVKKSAAAIGELLDTPYTLAFQSQGADGGDWLGPTLKGALHAARRRGMKRVAVAPFGFLGEHVETLYDLDVEAKAQCDELGLELARVPALGLAPGLIDTLEDLVKRALA